MISIMYHNIFAFPAENERASHFEIKLIAVWSKDPVSVLVFAGNPRLMTGHLATIWCYDLSEKWDLQPGFELLMVKPPPKDHMTKLWVFNNRITFTAVCSVPRLCVLQWFFF